MTHTDPKAEYGALAVAIAAHTAARGSTDFDIYLTDLQTALPDDTDACELLRILTLASASAARGESTPVFSAAAFGRSDRVTGYVYQTVPAAIHAWMRYPRSFREAISGVISCGGDTDTVAAITGAIVGAGVGEEGIPTEWVDGIAEWPHTMQWMRSLGACLASSPHRRSISNCPRASVPALMVRNGAFLLVVLITLVRWYGLDLVYFLRSVHKGPWGTPRSE
jgi:ADP-ribosylglycohydrolase